MGNGDPRLNPTWNFHIFIICPLAGKMFLSWCCVQELHVLLFLSLLYIAPHVSLTGEPARPGSFASIISLIKRAETFSPVAPDTELTSFSQVSGAILETSTSFQSTETVSVNMAPYGTTNWGPKRREQSTPGVHGCRCHHLPVLQGTQRVTSGQGHLACAWSCSKQWWFYSAFLTLWIAIYYWAEKLV